MNHDVVTLGETLLRLTPPGRELLERASTLEIHVAGSESNTAVALSRLGVRVCWLSRLPDNPLGERVRGELSRYGVDTGYVARAPGERLGTFYYQPASPPRASRVWYDRADSAMARMQPEHLPTEPFRPGAARLFHTTGITLGLGEAARATALAAVDRARAAGMHFSFDLNHRRNLWQADIARPHYRAALALAELVFVAERDIELLWPGADPQAFHAHCPQALLLVTRGERGALAITAEGKRYEQAAFPAAGVDRLGRGDAFSAGFLYQWLASGDIAESLRWGAALAALKYATPGDMAIVDRREVLALLEQDRNADLDR